MSKNNVHAKRETSARWAERSLILLLMLGFIIYNCGCEDRTVKPISAHYGLLVTRHYFGDTGVRVSLLGYSRAKLGEKPVVLCEFLHGTVGIFDAYSGRKAIFVERSYEGEQERSKVFICRDGRKIGEVTSKIVEIARAQGAVGPKAKLGMHFLFGGAELEKEQMIVRLVWLRADVGFRGDGVVVRWDQLLDGEGEE